MKHVLSMILAVILCHQLSAQSIRKFQGTEAKKMYSGASHYFLNEARGTVSFVRLAPESVVASSVAKEWLKDDILKLRPEEDAVEYASLDDRYGWTHVRYRQHYKGIPVEYSMYSIHSKGGVVQTVNGEWYRIPDLKTSPSVAPAEAYLAACNHVGAKVWFHEAEEKDNNRLVILPMDGSFYLAYKCDVYAREPLSRYWVYVDANTGNILKKESRLHQFEAIGTGISQYYGERSFTTDSVSPTSFYLRDYTRGDGIITYNGPNNVFYNKTNNIWDNDSIGVDVHFGTESTYDFYWNNYGHSGLDGDGSQMICHAHDGAYVNAFWDGVSARFGDGGLYNGETFTSLTDLMVVGHELTHGVTEFSSGLIYSGESGALNESFSDIFGAAIQQEYDPEQFNWYVPILNTGAFRNMANPNQYDCPDTYGGLFWNNGDIVHYNSGVQNFWYVLLTTGGSGVNDLGTSYFVEAIGFDDADQITYRNNVIYLTPSATFEDAREMSIQAAIDLFGDCSKQVLQTAAAWQAVGVGGAYEGSVTAIFSSGQQQYCTVPATVTFTNNSLNATDYWWDFGDGTTSTDANPVHTYSNTGVYTVTLIIQGVSACNSSDTMVKANYITTENFGQPVAASCNPPSILPGPKYGVLGFRLGTINNPSSNAQVEGYVDFSCSDFTSLNADLAHDFEIDLGSKGDDVRMWIDYNNNGSFEADELVYSADDVSNTVSGVLTIPAGAVTNTPLRLRISDEKKQYDITDACYSPQQGQVEDYGVVIEAVVACPKPSNPTTTKITATTADLNWEFAGTTEDFRVQYRKPSDPDWIAKTVPGDQLSTTLSGLEADTKYIWRVRARCTDDIKSDWTKKIPFSTMPLRAGVSENALVAVSLVPNPSSGQVALNITGNGEVAYLVRILDVTGREIDRWNHASAGSTQSMNLSGIPSGIYTIVVSADGFQDVQKLVLQR